MKVKFGVHIGPQLGYDYVNTQNIALVAEKLGYESFWCSDHLFLNEKSENQNCMDTMRKRTRRHSIGTKIRKLCYYFTTL